MNLVKFLEEKPKILSVLLSIFLIGIIALIDYKTPGISLPFFYVFPILIATWFAGLYAGIFISVTSSMMFLVDYAIPEEYHHYYPFVKYWDTLVFLAFFLLTTYLLSKLKFTLNRLEKLAKCDGLTGLTNRSFFMEIVSYELNRALRYKEPLTLAYLDIDDFKLVNDTWGHNVGDGLLCYVSEVAKKNLRKIDVISRLGGDEFAILLPHTGFEDAEIVLNRFHAILLDSLRSQGWPITFSIGAITFIRPPNSVVEMIEKADALMYRAKKTGKNSLKHELLNNAVSAK
jgi:diguanylate cyclase (GGDEF)-like protein